MQQRNLVRSLSSTQDYSAACDNVNLSPCRGPIFISAAGTLNSKAEHLLERIPENGCHVFLNPKTGAPYQLHEFYYLHKRILKQAGLPWVAFRNLQRQCMEVGI